ncbi:MAG: MotA/TolQ/ExbB proton channel family protein [Candidatus Omnitrophica bacterium]|jgi:biopolymer transport protein ExbB|nr:MotA/TolQ/ExbB proton channel family protein [Candidatus Omnitrophota bacterium]
MWLWISKGGLMMVPIMLCSVFAAAIIVERILFYFSKIRINSQALLGQIVDCVRKNKMSEAVDICEKNPYYMTNILKAGLVHYEDSREAIKEAIETSSLYELPKLEKNLSFLNMLANITPLLGLLGTAIGLFKSFYSISQKAISVGIVSQADIAIGLWQSLIATVGALTVALLASIFYQYFVHKVNFYILEVERASGELLEALSQRRYAGEI